MFFLDNLFSMFHGRGIFVFTLLFLGACGISKQIDHKTKPRMGADPSLDEDENERESYADADPRDPWVQGARRVFAGYPRPFVSSEQKTLSERFRIHGSIGRSVARDLRGDLPMLEFLGRTPRGLRNLCPRFERLAFDDKTRVYLAVFDALAYAESGYKDGLMYREKFKNRDGSPVISTGLLQISEKSARAHKGFCSNASTARLKEATFNVKCGFQIASNQVRKREALWFHDSSVYYWSTLSKGRNHRGFMRFAGRLADHVEKRSVWPTACGEPTGL